MTCKLGRILRPRSGIYVVNRSTLVGDADVRAWTEACAVQIASHVAPAYGKRPVRVQFLSSHTHAPAGAWVLVVMDDADQAGALGYHSVDRLGRIYGRIFTRPCLQYDVPVSTTLSHEIVETFCDPHVNRWVSTGEGFEVAYEACDPVEGDSYLIGGVAVSDFVCPGWYGKGGRTHWLPSLLAPFTLAAGGYYVKRLPDGTETQVFGAQARRDYVAAKAHELARTRRRGI